MRRDAGDLAIDRRGSQVTVKNNLFRVVFDLSKGTWGYSDKTGYNVIRDAYTQVVLKDKTVRSTLDVGTAEFITLPPASDDFGHYQTVAFAHQTPDSALRIHVYLNCYYRKPFVLLHVGVENLSERPLALDEISVINVAADQSAGGGAGVYLGSAPSNYHLFLNTEIRPTQAIRKLHDGFSINLNALNELCYDGVLHDTETQRALVFGFLSFQQWWSTIRIGYTSQRQQGREEKHGVNHWSLFHKCENRLCRKGELIHSELLYVNFADAALEGYQLYAEMVAQRMQARPLNHVFSSWRIAVNGENEEQVVEQIEQLAKNQVCPPMENALEYIQIEKSGGSLITGSDLDSPDMSNRFRAMAEHIHTVGLKAGLRFAPFSVDADIPLVKTHSAYFIKDKARGRPAILTAEDGREVALLDVSHPDARRYIRAHTKRVIEEWGYDLIKVDLLDYASGFLADPSNFTWHDTSLTSVQLYQQMLQLLKESAGNNKNLAGCNTSGSLNIGAFSLNESGYNSDPTKALWNEPYGLKRTINTFVSHLPMFNKAWTTEFGTLAIDEPLPLNEAIVALSAAALSGSAVICGDDLTRLKASRADLLGKVFPLAGKPAMPVDLYEKTYPQVWNLPLKSVHESWNVVGVFNWEDKIGTIEIPISLLGLDKSQYYLLHDFWNREFLGVVRGWVNLVELPPRSVKVLCLRPERDVPQLLSTDVHYTQGGVEMLSAGWDRRSQSFMAVCKPPRYCKGSLFVHVPEDYIPAATACYGATYHFRWKRPIYELEFGATSDLVSLSVQFAKTSG